MKAIVQEGYGGLDVLSLKEVERPSVADDQVLVQVRAASVNALDWRRMRAAPFIVRMMEGLRSPRQPVLGVDTAGVVREVGKDVTHLAPGDEVYGIGKGSFAEYTLGVHLAAKPRNLTFEEAAALPVAGSTSLQAVRDVAHVETGQHVLVNGAGGGVGTLTVQIAKAFGAEVTATTSADKVDLMRSLGADHVIDYTRDDFTTRSVRYDVIFEVGGKLTFPSCRDSLARDGKLIYVGAGSGPEGPLGRVVKGALRNKLLRQPVVTFVSKESTEDLVTITELVEAGKVKPVIDGTYPLTETAAAVERVESGHPRGKVVISVASE